MISTLRIARKFLSGFGIDSLTADISAVPRHLGPMEAAKCVASLGLPVLNLH